MEKSRCCLRRRVADNSMRVAGKARRQAQKWVPRMRADAAMAVMVKNGRATMVLRTRSVVVG